MRKLKITLPGRVRPRRLRQTQSMRDLTAETHLEANQFILPHFVLPTKKGEKTYSFNARHFTDGH